MTWIELVTLALFMTLSVQFSSPPPPPNHHHNAKWSPPPPPPSDSSSVIAVDQCDWSGSGVAQGFHKRSIRPVYLRCDQGHIRWKYPRGGLRVVLRHGTSGKEFRGCVKADENFHSGARIYVEEGHRTLHLLYSPNDGRPVSLLRCFASQNGQVALFVEATTVNGTDHQGVVEFRYDLRRRPPSSRLKQLEDVVDDRIVPDCQPCNDEDLLYLYCTSDFVVRGRMLKVHNNVRLERTELTVEAVKILKENGGVFKNVSGPNRSFLAPSHRRRRWQKQHSRAATWTGVLLFPLQCDAHLGTGHFLFLGRFLFDEPFVSCAPRWQDWTRVWNKAASHGQLQCF